jgi:proteasome accessory factor A
LETEYALVSNLLTQSSLSRENLADLIEETILSNHLWVRCNSFERRSSGRAGGGLVEIREGQFIENGSRVYYDAGHFEWANPETLDPHSAVLYEKAAECNLNEAVSQVNARLQGTHPGGWVMLAKNNVDYCSDASYGCHENYSLRRYDNRRKDIFARLADDLVPFLVTRQIFCGAGRIGARAAQPDDPIAFQLSQRADFIELLKSPNPREERGILNLRDEPLAEAQH